MQNFASCSAWRYVFQLRHGSHDWINYIEDFFIHMHTHSRRPMVEQAGANQEVGPNQDPNALLCWHYADPSNPQCARNSAVISYYRQTFWIQCGTRLVWCWGPRLRINSACQSNFTASYTNWALIMNLRLKGVVTIYSKCHKSRFSEWGCRWLEYLAKHDLLHAKAWSISNMLIMTSMFSILWSSDWLLILLSIFLHRGIHA